MLVHALIDFKSSGSLLLFRGPLATIERDYDVQLIILPFEAVQADLRGWRQYDLGSNARENLVRRHKLRAFQEYAALQQINSYGDFEGSSRLLLLGLEWLRQHSASRESIWQYCSRAFDAFHDPRVDHESLEVVQTMIRHVDSSPVGDFRAFVEQGSDQLVRALEPVAHAERRVFGVPCLVAPNGVMAYQPLAAGIVRWQLHEAGRARNANVLPDLPVAWRAPEPVMSPRTRGMPGTGGARLLQRYRSNASDPGHATSAAKVLDVYIDIKSPHAWLAVEMTRALEEDFDVRVNWRPFDLLLAQVYGDAKATVAKRSASSRVPAPVSFASEAEQNAPDRPAQQRTDAQRNVIKWTYADLRRYATLRGLTLFGTERVWDSTLVLKTLIFVKQQAHPLRAPLDAFLDAAFERLWRRDLNLHSLPALAQLARETAGVDVAALESFCADGGPGEAALGQELAAGARAGVFGVPSFVLDGHMLWGKEHLSLLRLKLSQQGLALRKDAPVDVPYLWRPDWPAASTL